MKRRLWATCSQFINETNRNGLNAIVFPIFYDYFSNLATKIRENVQELFRLLNYNHGSRSDAAVTFVACSVCIL